MLTAIHSFARQYGCIAGICDALPLAEPGAAPFVRWPPKARANPALCLPGAQNIAVLGRGYRPGNLRCVDYHTVLTRILEALALRLKAEGAVFAHRVMVDTGPLPEQTLAVKAGLGYRGRNGLVISEAFGSFFNIGLLLTDCALPLSEPARGRCPEGCRRCREACPAGAIGESGVDAYACASYHSQRKGAVRGVISGVYGCEVCRRVCPQNAHVPPCTAPPVEPAEILGLDAAGFRTRFGHTAMAWRGLGVLRRNAGIILGEKGDTHGILEQ